MSDKDTVYRQAAIDAIQKDRETSWKDLEYDDDEYRSGCDDGYAYSMRVISELPSVERKKGRWVNGKCDQCGGHAPFWPMASTYYRSRFCPNCGSFNGGEE